MTPNPNGNSFRPHLIELDSMKDPNHDGDSANGDHNRSNIVLESEQTKAPSDGNDRNYKRDPARYSDLYWEMGWTDGRLGQPITSSDEIIAQRSELERLKSISDIRGRIDAKKATVARLSTETADLPEQLRSLRERERTLLSQRTEKGYASSLPLGVIYTAVGLLLFVADLPLSLNLVAKGFDLPIKTNVSFNGLLANPIAEIFDILITDWQAIFLAMGIAFSGMFVKYYLDEFVFDSTNRTITTDDLFIKRAKRRKRWVVNLILLLFLVTTLILGVFRAYNKFVDDQIAAAAVAKTNAEAPNAAPNPLTPGFVLEAGNFVLLTLMFPIVGGVFFSAGWRRLEIAKEYYAVPIRIWWTEQYNAPSLAALRAAESELSALQHQLEVAEDDSLLIATKKLNHSLYRHGYHRGWTVPETLHVEERLYPQAKRIFEKVVAHNVRARLRQSSKQDNLHQ